MTAPGSPAAGASTDYTEIHQGRRCRVVANDWERHQPHLAGKTWAPHPHAFKVYEFEPEPEPAPVPVPAPEPAEDVAEVDLESLPEWMRTALKDQGSAHEVTEVARAAKTSKFEYHKALRGRFGKGRELSEPEYLVLNMLWDYSDGDLTNARPGNSRLAEDLGYSGKYAADTARGHVKSLEQKGFLICTRPSRGRGMASTYTLTLPEWTSRRRR